MNGVVVAETVRRSVTSIAYWSYAAFVAILALGASRFNAPGAMWPTLITLLSFIIGCVPVGPEFSSGTLQLILTKPVNRSVYLVSRVAGAVASVWIVAFIAFTLEILGRALWSDGTASGLVVTALIHSMVDVVLTCALLALFGSFTRAYFNIGLYLVLMVGLGIAQGTLSMMRSMGGGFGEWLRTHDILDRVLSFVTRNLFPDAPPRFDWHWILMVLSNAALALVAASFIFRKREVPYGAD